MLDLGPAHLRARENIAGAARRRGRCRRVRAPDTGRMIAPHVAWRAARPGHRPEKAEIIADLAAQRADSLQPGSHRWHLEKETGHLAKLGPGLGDPARELAGHRVVEIEHHAAGSNQASSETVSAQCQ